jgi:hypothetical protein
VDCILAPGVIGRADAIGLARWCAQSAFSFADFPSSARAGSAASASGAALLTGADGLLKPLINAWQILSKDNPDARVEIRFVTTDYPSTTDKPGDSTPAYSAEFVDQFERFPNRTLTEWRAAGWRNLIDRLLAESGLNEVAAAIAVPPAGPARQGSRRHSVARRRRSFNANSAARGFE